MGVGADNVVDRMAASVGELTGVAPVFQAVSDVPNGGVLLALPALLAVGLLHQAHKYFQLPKGYYRPHRFGQKSRPFSGQLPGEFANGSAPPGIGFSANQDVTL